MKSNSTVRPDTILPLGDGNYHFNYNVQENKTEEGTLSFDYDTLFIQGEPTYENIVKLLIREKYDESEEFALVNKYNAYMLGIGESKDVQPYKEYLGWVLEIKKMVKNSLL